MAAPLFPSFPYNRKPPPMDNLTHTAVGLFLCRAGLNRWTPRAAPILLLASNVPDIDIITASRGSLNYLHYHRHLTHSLLALPVMAILPVLLVRWAGRKPVHWAGAFAAALVAVASHLLLDWTNSYGIRPFLPFSDRWFQLDLNNVIDLWIWAVFLLALIGPFIGRLVSSEISSGTIRPQAHGRGFAIFALLFVLLYDFGRNVLNDRAVATLGARVYQGVPPARVAAFPDAANPLRWRGLVETADFYALADLDFTAGFDPSRATIFHKPDPEPAMEAARHTATFQEFLRFSQYPFWRVQPAPDLENGRLVEVSDLRFGTPQAPGFIASALVDSNLQVIQTSFHWGTVRPR